MVDEKHQIIVNAEAHGEGQEAHLLKPTLERTRDELKTADIFPDIFKQAKIITDAGYHSNASVSYIEEQAIDAYMADRSYRQRDPAFADYGRYKERTRQDKRRRYTRTRTDRFTVKDFFMMS